MVVAISNVVGFVGGALLIGFLIYIAMKGDPERAEEEAARVYFDEHGYWPDEAPGPPTNASTT